MKRYLVGWVGFAAVATLALLLARYLAPGRFELELDVFILALGGLALLEVVVATRAIYPHETRSLLAAALETEPDEPAQPPELERLQRELTLATTTAFDVHFRLRPLVQEIARVRLAARGRRLDESEDELDEELWELVRPERTPPENRHAPGLPPESLRHTVERLEAL